MDRSVKILEKKQEDFKQRIKKMWNMLATRQNSDHITRLLNLNENRSTSYGESFIVYPKNAPRGGPGVKLKEVHAFAAYLFNNGHGNLLPQEGEKQSRLWLLHHIEDSIERRALSLKQYEVLQDAAEFYLISEDTRTPEFYFFEQERKNNPEPEDNRTWAEIFAEL